MNKSIVAGALIVLVVLVGAYVVVMGLNTPSKVNAGNTANNSLTANTSLNSSANLLAIYNDNAMFTSQPPFNPTNFTEIIYANESGYFYISGASGVNDLLVMKNLSIVGRINNTSGNPIYDPADNYVYALVRNSNSTQTSQYYIGAIRNASIVAYIGFNSSPNGFPVYDSVYKRLYVPTNSSLLIVNNTKIVGSIPMEFAGEYGLVYSTKTGYIYMDNYTNTVKVIGENGVIGTISIPTNLMVFGISYDPENGYAYLGVYNSSVGENGVYAINGTNVVSYIPSIATISNINRYLITHGFYNSVTGHVYVFADYFNSTQNANHTVTIKIDDNATLQGTNRLMILENGSFYKNITLGETEQILAHIENRFGYVYLLVRNSTNNVYHYGMTVLDRNDTIVATLPLGNYTPSGTFGTYAGWKANGYSGTYTQYNFLYDNTTNRVYVSYRLPYAVPPSMNRIYVLDNTTISSIQTNTSMGYYMFYNPGNGYAYAIN